MREMKSGEKLRMYRNKKRYSLRELSKLTGIPFSTIAAYEKGWVKLKGDAITKFTKCFGIRPEDLSDDDELTEREETYRQLLQNLLLKVTYEVPVYESSSIDGEPVSKMEVPPEIARKIDIIVKSKNIILEEEGIVEGTLMFVRKTSYPEIGDIVLLKKDGDLKIIKIEGEAEGSIYKNRYLQDWYEVFGVVLYLFKEVRK